MNPNILAVAFLTLFVFSNTLFSKEHTETAWSFGVVPLVHKVIQESVNQRKIRLGKIDFSFEDMEKTYLILESPLIKKVENKYGPVRFMHKKHAVILNKDCNSCHHKTPDLEDAKDITRCSACHQNAFNPLIPDRVGLKGAYHIGCINCHQKMGKGPTKDCTGCHTKNVVDHSSLIKLKKKASNKDVIQECLRCHKETPTNILKSAHGKNYKNPNDIDCLVCHDTTDTYRENKKHLDLVSIAKKVGHPSPSNCGICHFKSSAKDVNLTHANLNPKLKTADDALDVHMGTMGFDCQSCHTTNNHKDLTQKITCEKCHTDTPHGGGIVSLHLNMHSGHVACNTCHTPTSLDKVPVKIWWNKAIDYDKLKDRPEGHIKNPKSKLYPFNVFKSDQSSGNDIYLNVDHEVVPKEYALTCATCHDSLAPTCVQCHTNKLKKRTCNLCHQDTWRGNYKKFVADNLKLKKYCRTARAGQSIPTKVKAPAINFKKLGYKGDPAVYGGRFRKLPLGVTHKKGKGN